MSVNVTADCFCRVFAVMSFTAEVNEGGLNTRMAAASLLFGLLVSSGGCKACFLLG